MTPLRRILDACITVAAEESFSVRGRNEGRNETSKCLINVHVRKLISNIRTQISLKCMPSVSQYQQRTKWNNLFVLFFLYHSNLMTAQIGGVKHKPLQILSTPVLCFLNNSFLSVSFLDFLWCSKHKRKCNFPSEVPDSQCYLQPAADCFSYTHSEVGGSSLEAEWAARQVPLVLGCFLALTLACWGLGSVELGLSASAHRFPSWSWVSCWMEMDRTGQQRSGEEKRSPQTPWWQIG